MSAGPDDVSCAVVAVPVPIRRRFTYAVPGSLRAELTVGLRVKVPFGPRRVLGTVVEYPAALPLEPEVRLREIVGVVEDGPVLPADVLSLTRFVSDYYLCSQGEAIEAALPPEVTRVVRRYVRQLPSAAPESLPRRATSQRRILAELPGSGEAIPMTALGVCSPSALRSLVARGWVEVVERRERGDSDRTVLALGAPDAPLPPTPAQAEVLAPIRAAAACRVFAPFLLYGATGSGKTEVYLQAAAAVLEAGRGVLYLVPEIGLTPMLVRRVERRFPGNVAVLHSGLSDRERRNGWDRIARGDRRFVIGTRSAVFAPLRDPGLVVVDEEHDGSYKQEESPRYNGRDLAVVRGQQTSAVVVLGSATPSLESFRHARTGRYTLLRLGGRVENRPLPPVTIVDMREEFGRVGEVLPISRVLREALDECLERGEQALILRNRRGWASALFCPVCGLRIECENCSLTLTWHEAERRLRCHTCGFERRRPEGCPRCGKSELRLLGQGTERIEDELRRLFPRARIARMDRDTVRRRGAHESILRRFERGEIDVIIGTQMIAKGHDFPRVTVVGVLSADQALGIPDFRAAERTFQLLTQVEGRAGRGEHPGRVIVQAFDPTHPALRQAALHDYEGFYAREIAYRRALRYPPVTALVRILVSDRDPSRARLGMERVARALREQGVPLLVTEGPAPVERAQGLWRFHVLARTAGRRRLVEAVDAALETVEKERPYRSLVVDVDPMSLG